jgi:hypothetical protein
MDLKEQLLATLLDNLKYESAEVFGEYVDKYKKQDDSVLLNSRNSNISFKGSIRFQKRMLANDTADYMFEMSSASSIRGVLIKALIGIIFISIIVFLFYLGGKFVSNQLKLNLFGAILSEVGVLAGLFVLGLFVRFLIKYTYSSFENKFVSIKPKPVEAKKEFEDDVYYIISDTYETLSVFRNERERQAKNSFNAALSLIIAGIIIFFVGVYLLFRKNITEGSLTSSFGAISNILGGTIIKFYRDTNNRMDKLNDDLSVLYSAKVQYAMILKISDLNKRDNELSILIKSIGKIKSTVYNTRYSQ